MIFLNRGRQQPGGYFCISTKDREGTWKDHFFKRTALGNVPKWLRDHSDKDLYFCPHGFLKPRRLKKFAVIPKLLSSYGGSTNNHGTPVTIRTSDQVNSKLLDSRAVWASETLANGMHSGLTSPSRPWFKLTLSDPEMRERQAVKIWLDEVERRIYDLFAKTNFYTTAKSGYRELGLYGVEAGLMERHWRYGMVCHPLTAGEYWLGVDDGSESVRWEVRGEVARGYAVRVQIEGRAE